MDSKQEKDHADEQEVPALPMLPVQGKTTFTLQTMIPLRTPKTF
eukprot:CAMPEP_0184345266 /NCGR_PEP_ID=MMETSP1089-20130417/13701_1 /TAXON_ID=38269 ORGANISM="Gloeochaete wittrockiana, Strain SAG46.84" /NCGR_SAMPLE_ID=MMETSP1089 /ASSEMBLY_ACC=CAM_ASM_000445 /LENGTH=43 /DNA_ID= /DNA_START= /DNA_END= /DNA_ORIENTATION=